MVHALLIIPSFMVCREGLGVYSNGCIPIKISAKQKSRRHQLEVDSAYMYCCSKGV